MKSTTRGQHSFAQIPSVNIPRSVLNRSCGYKTTFDAGYLIPIFRDDMLPGDTINLTATMLCRMPTLINPIMDNVWLDTQWFFVPMRLIYDEWEHMMGAQDNPDDDTSFVLPTMTGPAGPLGIIERSLSDYLGLPIYVKDLVFTSIYHRAYNLIWNEWYRDENLQDSVVVDKDEGPDTYTDYVLLKRGKRHDYFTSALPFLQKGDAVTLPLGTTAPVVGTGDGIPDFQFDGGSAATDVTFLAPATGNIAYWSDTNIGAYAAEWDNTKLVADLENATAATINTIRQAFQMQRLLERDARGGTRYPELVKSHFGVTSADARLQRPEFLAASSTPILSRSVPATAYNSGQELWPGSLGAYALGTDVTRGITKSFTEHGILMGLASIRADLNYQQGLPREFSRSTRYDFFWPSLAHLGEQSILNKEIYCQGSDNPTQDEAVFGYQERYAELRYKPSLVTSTMRSTAVTPLHNWHLAQEFESLPVLNDAFIQEDPPIGRVCAFSEDTFVLDCYFSYRHARPIPVYGVPGMTDHF